MKINSKNILEEFYKSGILADFETSKEYNNLLHKYNELYGKIENEQLKKQFNKLEEIKNKLYSQNNQDIFKLGFSIATKAMTEAFNTKTIKI